jgi:hypothetical protein
MIDWTALGVAVHGVGSLESGDSDPGGAIGRREGALAPTEPPGTTRSGCPARRRPSCRHVATSVTIGATSRLPAGIPYPRRPDLSFILHLFARELGILGSEPDPLSVRDHSGPGPSRPTAPDRPAQLGDHLGCQSDPPGAVRDCLNAIQPPRSAPGTDGRDIHIQLLGRFLDRTPPVAAIAVRSRGRTLRTTAGN